MRLALIVFPLLLLLLSCSSGYVRISTLPNRVILAEPVVKPRLPASDFVTSTEFTVSLDVDGRVIDVVNEGDVNAKKGLKIFSNVSDKDLEYLPMTSELQTYVETMIRKSRYFPYKINGKPTQIMFTCPVVIVKKDETVDFQVCELRD